MIFGHIRETQAILGTLPVPLQTALKHLAETDFASLPAGKYELQGNDIFVLVIDLTTKAAEENKPEVHRKYIDVQFLFRGRERIGAASDTGHNVVAQDMLSDRDLLFYQGMENETMLEMVPGNFAVFFPWDAHRPGCQAGQPEAIRKVVVKVAVALLGNSTAG